MHGSAAVHKLPEKKNQRQSARYSNDIILAMQGNKFWWIKIDKYMSNSF